MRARTLMQAHACQHSQSVSLFSLSRLTHRVRGEKATVVDETQTPNREDQRIKENEESKRKTQANKNDRINKK